MKNNKYTFLVGALLFLLVGCSDESLIQNEEATCDNGIFVGDVVLITQQEVDDFGALCYSEVVGDIKIGVTFCNPALSCDGIDTDIVDLSPLINLQKVDGVLFVMGNSSLESLEGLSNLNEVNTLFINNNQNLLDLDGISNLNIINGGLSIGFNFNLQDLTGLQNITQLNSGLRIEVNRLITNLDFLSNLSSVDGNIYVVYNNGLNDLCGLQNLFTNGNFDQDNVIITGNNFTPTVQDIINGNCSQ
ncbi:MAG: hypothetical protein ACWA5P_14335 [bacterium]